MEVPETILNFLKSVFLVPQREMSGRTVRSIEQILREHDLFSLRRIAHSWYRDARVVTYESKSDATAYLAAYGPRSILTYQDALLSWLTIRRRFPNPLKIVDYGCGPAIGVLALGDLWSRLADALACKLEIEYVGVDRSPAMLELASDLAQMTTQNLHWRLDCRFVSPSQLSLAFPDLTESNLVIISNVVNEAEGQTDLSRFVSEVTGSINLVGDLISIEPASEQSSRQMCSLARNLPGYHKLGPCISRDTHCREWTFRTVSKRSYFFERQVLGERQSAATRLKYSMAIIGTVPGPPSPVRFGTLLMAPNSAGISLVCVDGTPRFTRVASYTGPWDLIDLNVYETRSWH